MLLWAGSDKLKVKFGNRRMPENTLFTSRSLIRGYVNGLELSACIKVQINHRGECGFVTGCSGLVPGAIWALIGRLLGGDVRLRQPSLE